MFNQRVRIFKSALNGVRYVNGQPLTVRQWLALSPAQQAALAAKVRD